MISLKRHMVQHVEETLAAALDAYRGLVNAVAESGGKACPILADDFRQSLLGLREQLGDSVGAVEVGTASQEIERRVGDWGSRAGDYYNAKTVEIREVLLAMAEAAAAAGTRNQHYRQQFTEVSARLHGMGDLEDLGTIRQMVRQTATELKSSADRMAQESEKSMAALQSQVVAYQQKLEAAEAEAHKDSLTGLVNRAGVTRAFEVRMQLGRPFTVLLADLNGFKQLNDRHGHLAGDEVLKMFAAELRNHFRALDVVARWGGDEFVVLIDAPEQEIQSRLSAVRHWAFGDYTVKVGGKSLKTPVSAAIGSASWKPGMTLEQVIAAADRAMYQDKGKNAR